MSEPSIWRTPPGEKSEGDLVDQLTDYGREQMLAELAAAFHGNNPGYLGLPPDSLSSPEQIVLLRRWIKGVSGSGFPTDRVVESYRRTALIRQNPDYERNMARAGKTPPELGERVHTLEELRRELRLDEEGEV